MVTNILETLYLHAWGMLYLTPNLLLNVRYMTNGRACGTEECIGLVHLHIQMSPP